MRALERCSRLDRLSYGRSRASIRSGRGGYVHDHLTFVPASQLPFKKHWEQIARRLPSGEVLLVLPNNEAPLLRVLRALVPQFHARGRHITTIESIRC